MKARTRSALVGLATMAAAAGPMLATSCWDIVLAPNDMPVPCGAANYGQPCNSCPTLIHTIVPGGTCEKMYSVIPPEEVQCIGGTIILFERQDGSWGCASAWSRP